MTTHSQKHWMTIVIATVTERWKLGGGATMAVEAEERQPAVGVGKCPTATRSVSKNVKVSFPTELWAWQTCQLELLVGQAAEDP